MCPLMTEQRPVEPRPPNAPDRPVQPYTPEEIATSVMQSEAMMWLMVGANHVESHLDILREAWAAYIAAGGLTYGKTKW